MKRTLALVFGLVLVMLGPVPPVVTATPGPTGCADLAGTRIPAALIALPTGGGQVTSARLVPAAGTGPSAIGEYCRVDAAIRPVDPAAPDINLRIGLPTGWNRKTMMFGGGGYNGTIPDIAGNVPYGPADARTPLGRGYATFAGDSGHQAAPDFKPVTSLDGSFGRNDEALRNFAGDALKKTRDAAVFLLGKYYRARPAQEFFAGGSTGGREALAVAQRWPADFDGVLSVYPAWNAASLDLFFGYQAQLLSRPGAFPGPAKQALLYDRVRGTCDRLDGLVDGVISDEPGCHVDPAILRCPGGTDLGDGCLSDAQIDAVTRMSSPLRWHYPLASGERGYPGFPFLSGADLTTPLLGVGTAAPADPMPKNSGYGVQFWDQWVKYFVTRDPAVNSLRLDPRAPGRWWWRISELSALQDVNNPDLRPFARAGGKLLLVHGTADELVSHRSTADYFERLRHVAGDRQVDRFARFYLVPGANHVNVDAAFAAGWDSVSALEDWVARGKAPERQVVTDKNPAALGRTRPLCEYPGWPRYTGTGDPNSAASFSCHR